jgi:predicted metal-dependent hydrolase
MRIRVGADQPLEILVPEHSADEQIDAALRAKARWIAQKLDLTEHRRTRRAALGLDRPDVVWLDGEAINLRRVDGIRSTATLRQGQLVVSGPDPTAAVLRWYRREARSRLPQIVTSEARRLGISPSSVAVRDQRTRWGSCSPAGAISLNWRLLLTPVDVQRYVAVHELCHLTIANHRKSFWRLLNTAIPDWRGADRWLRQHGDELRGYRITVEGKPR